MKDKLKNRINDYRGGFTVHGLSWLCTGSLPERVVWGLSILLAFGFAVYMVDCYVQKFLKYEWRTEIRQVEEIKILQPVIVFCTSSFTSIFSCYKNISFADNSSCTTNITKSTELHYQHLTTLKWTEEDVEYLGNNCHAINADRSMKLARTDQYLPTMFRSNLPEEYLMMYLYASDAFDGKFLKNPLVSDQVTFLKPGEHRLFISQTKIERLADPF